MKYERLTKTHDYCSDCCDGYRNCEEKQSCYECTLYDRLAELEDKIESGKMIELPCKVGDTVYTLDLEELKVDEWEVIGILIQEEFFLKIINKKTYVCKLWGVKSIIFDKSQAEARLKELQNEE